MNQGYLTVDEILDDQQQALLAGWQPALDSIADGAVVMAPDGRVVYLSSRAEQLFGVAQQDVLGLTLHEFPLSVTTHDGRPLPQDFLPSWHVARTGHSILDFEMHLTLRSGVQHNVMANIAPILAPGGAIALILATLLDRTITQQTAIHLRENERFLNNIYASIQDGISILSPDLTVLSVNPAMERWNTPRLPLLGKRCYEAYHGRAVPCDDCPTLRTLHTGRASQATVPLRNEQGEEIGWVDLFTFPLLHEETGEITGVIEYVRNITERMDAECALRAAQAQERQFLDRLRALHDVRNLLFKAVTLGALFQQAVEMGHAHLGFERVSIWLCDPDDSAAIIGTFGIDEHGMSRDERGIRVTLAPDSMMGRLAAAGARSCACEPDNPLYDQHGQVIGHGAHLIAPIWDAQEIIGFLSVDNALTQQSPKEELRELMELYASVLGHRIIRLKSEASLRQSEAKYRLLAEHVSDLIWTADFDGRLTYVSPSILRMTGYQPEESLRHSLFDLLTPTSAEQARMLLDGALAHESGGDGDPDSARVLEVELQRRDGATVWTESTVSFQRDDAGRAVSLLGVTRDITSRKQAESRLSYLAYYDALTGLPNRLLLYDRLGRVLTRLTREQTLAAVMLLDLDHFKDVNDTYGHSAGDELLVQVAKRLNGCVRESDTVARMSGDEFVLLLPLIGAHEHAAATAQRVLTTFAAPFPIAGRQLTVTPSLGISFAPDDALTPELLLQHADLAMYAAKAGGRNACVVYTPELADRDDLRVPRPPD